MPLTGIVCGSARTWWSGARYRDCVVVMERGEKLLDVGAWISRAEGISSVSEQSFQAPSEI